MRRYRGGLVPSSTHHSPSLATRPHQAPPIPTDPDDRGDCRRDSEGIEGGFRMYVEGVQKVYREMEGFLKASFPPRAIRQRLGKNT